MSTSPDTSAHLDAVSLPTMSEKVARRGAMTALLDAAVAPLVVVGGIAATVGLDTGWAFAPAILIFAALDRTSAVALIASNPHLL